MKQEKLIEDMIRETLMKLGLGSDLTKAYTSETSTSTANQRDLNPDKDYPLATKRPDLVKTPRGKNLASITLNNVLTGEITSDDLRITGETLLMQAEIAEGVNRPQFANNLRRAAELTRIPDERILEIYNALRPYRSTENELLDIAGELENKYNAKINAAFIKEAAEVYKRRNRLRTE